jgi:two-component system NtrC family sensor kinase
MFIRNSSEPENSADCRQRYETVHSNLLQRIKQLKHANHELANQIAERPQVEEARPQADQKYCSMFDHAVVGFFQIAPDGRYQACNPALARIYGYESEEKLLANLTNIWRQFYVEPQRRYQLIEQMYSCDSVSGFESQVYRQDGSIIWIVEDICPVIDEEGKLLYYQGFVVDITKQKLAEESARRLEAELKIKTQQLEHIQSKLVTSEKMANLGRLVLGVAHEIRNPVNCVCNNLIPATQYAEDLLNLLQLYAKHYPHPVAEIEEEAAAIDLDFLMEDFPKTLSSIQCGSERLFQLIHSLLLVKPREEAQMTLVDIHQGIDSTLLIINHRLKPQGNNLGINLIKDYGDLPLIECYPSLLNQVFMNLLGNAVDALEEAYSNLDNPQNSPTITIRTEVINDSNDRDFFSGRAVVRIIDNGLGMPEELTSQIFNPFFTTKLPDKGTGLGLSISHQIVVEKHGGQLTCLSSPNKGTEFVMEIPLRRPLV